jgi:hypothetical protein
MEPNRALRTSHIQVSCVATGLAVLAVLEIDAKASRHDV